MAATVLVVKSAEKRMTLYPSVKGFSNSIGRLRERYSEDTADVFFVDKETKERLPAHREVLRVNSAVFFKMFNGDWKEKEEKEIPAPEEYSWESLKAAITLLYGEEFEVNESSIPDIYRVAHCYDLGEVLPILVHAVSQWDDSRLATALELCAIAADEKDVMQAVVKFIALNLEKIKVKVKEMRLKWCGLPYDAMLMLVQSDDISALEVTLLDLLNKWTEGQTEILLAKVQKLYSHIRYGIVPYENLLSCVTHKNLSAVCRMHQRLSIDSVRENVSQLTPRPHQKDVFQVYPMTNDLVVTRRKGKWEFMDCTSSPSIGVFYTGRQEHMFELDVTANCRSHPSLFLELKSVCDVNEPIVGLHSGLGGSLGRTSGLNMGGATGFNLGGATGFNLSGATGFNLGMVPNTAPKHNPSVHNVDDSRHLVVTLRPGGASVVARAGDNVHCECKRTNHQLTCSGAFPWLFVIGFNTRDEHSIAICLLASDRQKL